MKRVAERIDAGKDPRKMTMTEKVKLLYGKTDTRFRWIPGNGQRYYHGSYAPTGMYHGYEYNYVGVGVGLAAIGDSRRAVDNAVLGHNLIYKHEIPTDGMFYFARAGYDYYLANH